MGMKKKLVMVFLAVAFAFTAQAATIRWQWQNATQSMAEFLGAYSGNALSPNAVAYLIVGTPFTDDSGIMDAVAGGAFDSLGGYEDRIICTQPVAAFPKGVPGPFPGSYIFSGFTSEDSAYLDDLGPTIHGLFMIVIDTDADMYDYYTFIPRAPNSYGLSSSLYFSTVIGYFPDVTIIPEPSTALLALAGAATLLLRRRGSSD